MQRKQCPQCATPADLSAAFCLTCGRKYNTQFVVPPVQQTQMLPVATPVVTNPYGPKDRTEWNVSAFWHWFGLFLFAGYFAWAGWFFVHGWPLMPALAILGTIVSLILSAFAASFCIMRLRRLYVYFTSERRPWWISAFLLSVILLAPIALAEFYYQRSEMEYNQRLAEVHAERLESDRQEALRTEQLRQERQEEMSHPIYHADSYTPPPTYMPDNQHLPSNQGSPVYSTPYVQPRPSQGFGSPRSYTPRSGFGGNPVSPPSRQGMSGTGAFNL